MFSASSLAQMITETGYSCDEDFAGDLYTASLRKKNK
jgi:hypothetical protein